MTEIQTQIREVPAKELPLEQAPAGQFSWASLWSPDQEKAIAECRKLAEKVASEVMGYPEKTRADLFNKKYSDAIAKSAGGKSAEIAGAEGD